MTTIDPSRVSSRARRERLGMPMSVMRAILVLAAALSALGCAGVVVVSTGDAARDVAAVQAAVDGAADGGIVRLRRGPGTGGFAFGTEKVFLGRAATAAAPESPFTKSITILGEPSHGEPPVILGGRVPFDVTAPGRRIEIAGLHFHNYSSIATVVRKAGDVVVRDNRHSGVRAGGAPDQAAGREIVAAYSVRVSFFEPLFDALNRAGVRYVVVGGFATVLHGHARLTADIDIVVDLVPDEAKKVVEALTSLGFRPRAPVDPLAFADPVIRQQWVKDKGMRVFSLWDPANPMLEVDLFAEHPIEFEGLWNRAEIVTLTSTAVRIAAIPDLVHLKRLAGRPQDLTDIEALELILRRREGPDARR
jgi:hypothetical protein